MHIQVDTGHRLDKSGDTTFAFSNDIQKVIRLKQRDRDQCLQALKGSKLSKELRILAACIYLLIQDHLDDLANIIIDNEYDGHQGDIKRHLLNLIKTHTDPYFEDSKIQVEEVGKKSKVHKLAWKTYRKEHRADKNIQAQEILNLLIS